MQKHNSMSQVLRLRGKSFFFKHKLLKISVP